MRVLVLLRIGRFVRVCARLSSSGCHVARGKAYTQFFCFCVSDATPADLTGASLAFGPVLTYNANSQRASRREALSTMAQPVRVRALAGARMSCCALCVFALALTA